MQEITSLPEIQCMAIKLLTWFDSFCREQKIQYYVAYGTLLGTIRHQGFIPWDDDIDIWMKREDLDRFINCYKNVRGVQEVYLNCASTVDQYNRVHAQLCLADTKLVPNDRSNPFKEGYFIDIFPLDGSPNNGFQRWWHMTRLQILKNIGTLTAYESKGHYTGVKGALLSILSKPFHGKNPCRFMKRYEKVAGKYRCDQSEYLQVIAPGRRNGRNIIIQQTAFSKAVSKSFEGMTVPAPIGYDTILKEIYGNYMELPPEEQRRPHHDFKLFHIDG